jgi:hypothetical protein
VRFIVNFRPSKEKPMGYNINYELLKQSHTTLFPKKDLYWLVGGAGSGKTVISQSLSAKYNIPVYDMDAHIYGTYHNRFSEEQHPVNSAWAASRNGFAWLLDMTWSDFNNFNQAALVEYLDLLSQDIRRSCVDTRLIIDGGVCNPFILTHVLSPRQIVCLANPGQSSVDIWESDERKSMKELAYQLPNPEEAWRTFLEFDGKITSTILQECQGNGITVLVRNTGETVDELAARVANAFGLD